MKIKELIQKLQKYEDDAEVFISVDEEFNNIKQIRCALPTMNIKNSKQNVILVPNDFGDDYEF